VDWLCRNSSLALPRAERSPSHCFQPYAEAAQAFIAAMTQIGSDRATQAAQIAEGYGHPADMKFFAFTRGADTHGLAGLMVLKVKDTAIKVEDVCTDPRTRGVGIQLIERAVLESVKVGKGGRLTLSDMSGSDFYDQLGFKLVDPPLTKSLDPGTSSVWQVAGKTWKVKRR